MKVIIVFLFIICLYKVSGQEIQKINFFGKDTVGIEYFDMTDPKPRVLKIKGKILDVSTSTSCGIFLSSGTLMIKVRQSNKKYLDSLAFVVVGCLTEKDALINREITLRLHALFENNKECYKPILNSFNSNGIPFYWLTPRERIKFFKKIRK